MAELNWQEQEELNSGSAVDDTMFGGFISALVGLFIPSKSASTQGAYYKQFVNFVDSIVRRISNAFAGYIYKDSADIDLKYSVKAFKIKNRIADGTYAIGTYAGETAKGPLTVSVANYIYADLSAFPTITIGSSTSGWPTGIHAELAIITPPATGSWKLQHLERRSHVHALNVLTAGAVAAANLADAVADEILTATATVGAEASNVIRVTMQIKDAQGNNLSGVRKVDWNLSDTASAASETAQAPTVAYINGAAWQSVTANKKAAAFTDSTGKLVLDVTLSGAYTIYAVCAVGGKVCSVALVYA